LVACIEGVTLQVSGGFQQRRKVTALLALLRAGACPRCNFKLTMDIITMGPNGVLFSFLRFWCSFQLLGVKFWVINYYQLHWKTFYIWH
jgi:hypothetical protein